MSHCKKGASNTEYRYTGVTIVNMNEAHGSFIVFPAIIDRMDFSSSVALYDFQDSGLRYNLQSKATDMLKLEQRRICTDIIWWITSNSSTFPMSPFLPYEQYRQSLHGKESSSFPYIPRSINKSRPAWKENIFGACIECLCHGR
jgi:hypothetical protein